MVQEVFKRRATDRGQKVSPEIIKDRTLDRLFREAMKGRYLKMRKTDQPEILTNFRQRFSMVTGKVMEVLGEPENSTDEEEIEEEKIMAITIGTLIGYVGGLMLGSALYDEGFRNPSDGLLDQLEGLFVHKLAPMIMNGVDVKELDETMLKKIFREHIIPVIKEQSTLFKGDCPVPVKTKLKKAEAENLELRKALENCGQVIEVQDEIARKAHESLQYANTRVVELQENQPSVLKEFFFRVGAEVITNCLANRGKQD